MKTKNLILITVLICFFSAGCESMQDILKIQKPTASIKGLKFEDITLDSAALLFDVQVNNPYPVALPLMNVDYGLSSDAKQLFSGDAKIASTVPAKSSKTVSLPVKVSYWDLVKAFKGIRPGSKIPYKADLGLSVDAPALGVIRIPLKKAGELSVPTIPKIDEVDWKGIILDKIGQN